LEEALGGKEFILLYASAHWCGPCRQFTPKLVNWYNTIGGKSSTVEVVFLSADHDASSFQKYYASMPWLAVDYDDDTREKIMAWIRVTGIPRLAVMNARTGTIIEDNAVGKSLDVNRWRQLAAANKK
jgi:nucleoredoxin